MNTCMLRLVISQKSAANISREQILPRNNNNTDFHLIVALYFNINARTPKALRKLLTVVLATSLTFVLMHQQGSHVPSGANHGSETWHSGLVVVYTTFPLHNVFTTKLFTTQQLHYKSFPLHSFFTTQLLHYTTFALHNFFTTQLFHYAQAQLKQAITQHDKALLSNCNANILPCKLCKL